MVKINNGTYQICKVHLRTDFLRMHSNKRHVRNLAPISNNPPDAKKILKYIFFYYELLTQLDSI